MSYKLAETLLKLENVSLAFGEKLVLRDINLEVKNIINDSTCTGQVITLLGRSGVGKTQLMRIISGLLKPTEGEVLVKQGKGMASVEPGVVGMVLQSYPLFQHRTLRSNLELVSDDSMKIGQYLHDFDIFEHADKYPAQLSGGQRQRAAIVQQILCSEHFILLDEPFSGLDPVSTEKLIKAVTRIANSDEDNTVIISSHILEPALAISDELIMLGHESEAETNKQIPGATIRYKYDLAAAGLAWRPDIRKDPQFIQLVEDVRKIFQSL